jgi:predicted RND superfamily exporter protein
VLVGFLVAGFFDFRFYFIEHRYIVLGLGVIGPIAVFVVLYFVRSRLAWAVSLITIVILVVALLLTNQLGYMGFPLTLPVASTDVLLFTIFVGYVWSRRDSYFRYVAAKEI